MKALVAAPDSPALIEMREVDEPAAAADEAIVEVRAFGLNRGELSLIAARPGWRPGQDVAGVVAEAAPGGQGPRAGARVVAIVDGGGWAERVAAPVTRMAELPETVEFRTAATLPVAGLTALRALQEGGAVLGRRVLVTGASGGVGHFAVQLAAVGGAHVTAAVGSRERGAELLERGATNVVTYDEDFGDLSEVVLESVGGPVLEASVKALAAGGVAVLYGRASDQPARISPASFNRRHGVSIRSFFIYETGVETFGRDLGYLAGLVAEGRLRPLIGLEASWRETGRALAQLRDRRLTGKAVLLVD